MSSPLTWLKKQIEPFISPLVRPLSRLKIRPNHLTLLAFLSGLAALYFLLQDWMLFTIFALLNIFFDILDGALARATGAETTQGRFFDFWGDRIIGYGLVVKSAYVGLIGNAIILAAIALAIGLISHLWHFRSKKDVPVLTAKGLMLILGMVKFSWLIIPVALTAYSLSLIWQIWYSLNNL